MLSHEIEKKAKAFIQHNRQFKIISGQWLDANKQPIINPADATYLRYRFANGSIRTVHKDVVEKIHSSRFKTQWVR